MSAQPASTDLRLAPYGALALRVGLGVVFLAHALSKPLLFTMPGTAEFFARHGFPGWAAYPVFVLELVGGALLLLGLGARWAALALIPVTAGALVVHAPNGWLFVYPGGGWEYPAFLIAALAAQALVGDGAYRLRVPLPRGCPTPPAEAAPVRGGSRAWAGRRSAGVADDLD
jgi:putative oxidoreductase